MTVGSVVNAIAILRYLESGKSQGANAIARALSLNPSTCFNLLKTLSNEGFLEFESVTKTYRFSPPLWITRHGAGLSDWMEWFRTELQSKAILYSCTCGIWQMISDRLVLLEVVDSPLETRIHLSVGQRLPKYIGATGRCIAAYEQLSLDEVSHVIGKLRWEDPPSPLDYWNDIQNARIQGWALDLGNLLRGVMTVAAPVARRDGRILYCLSCTLFVGQLDIRMLPELGATIASLAQEAGRRLSEGID